MYVFEGERGDAVPEGTGRVGQRPAVLNPGHHILHFLAAVRYVFYRGRGTPVQKGQRKKYIANFRLVQVWGRGGQTVDIADNYRCNVSIGKFF